jgi:RNA polymerase sigma-B factor
MSPGEQAARRLIDAVHSAATESERCAAMEAAVVAHLPLARSLARRYLQKGVEAEDLEQVAALALVKAVTRYDVTAETPFGAYATPTITGELRRHFRDHGWLVRPPRRIQEQRQEMTRAREELTRDLGRPPTSAELASAMGLDLETLGQLEIAEQNLRPTSLDAPAPDADAGCPDPARPDARSLEDRTSDDVETRVVVRDAVRSLPLEAQRLVHLRFTEGLSQREVAAQLGLSPMAVSRLQRRTLEALGERLADLAPAHLRRTA